MSADETTPQTVTEEEQAPAPWHFKLLLVGLILYLLYRGVQGVMWLADRIG